MICPEKLTYLLITSSIMEDIFVLAARQEGLYQGDYNPKDHVPFTFVSAHPDESGEQIHRRWKMTVGLGTHTFFNICEPEERGVMPVAYLLTNDRTNGEDILKSWKRKVAASRNKPVQRAGTQYRDYDTMEADAEYCARSSAKIRSRKSPLE